MSKKIVGAVSHHEREIAELRADRDLAVEYLKAAMESLDNPDDRAAGLLALRTVAEAYGGLGAVAAEFEQVRYGIYQSEVRLLARLPAWRLWEVRLYALVDTSLTDRPVEVAAAVVRGGAGAVQLRAKNLNIRAYRELAERVAAVVRQAGGLFVVNDHVAVAAVVAADAVHVGQDDLSVADARAVAGALCAVGQAS